MAIILPKINSGLVSDYAFMQEGYEYGINDTGSWQRFTRRGLNADVESWANLLANAGWTVTVTRERVADGSGSGDTGYNSATADRGISKVEATAGWPFPYVYGTETPEDIWELDPQDEQKNLLDADFPENMSLSLTSRTTRDVLNTMSESGGKWNDDAMIFFAINNGQNTASYVFDDGVDSPSIPNIFHLPSADYPSAKEFYYLLRAGVTAFPIEASIIRHSLVTSNQYAVQASYNNMYRLISSGSMYSIEGVPGGLLFDVPVYPDANQFIQTPGDLQYGWRKVRPAITRLNRMKWRIQQNYQFGLWAITLYGNVL